MKIRPATTGDTANGRSISVISRLLPRKSNLAMAQAAATPNSDVEGQHGQRDDDGQPDRRTAFPARSAPRDRLGKPCARASTKTATSGRPEEEEQEAEADREQRERTQAGSVVARGQFVAAHASAAMRLAGRHFQRLGVLVTIGRPPLQGVDGQQQHEGNRQHHHGQRGGAEHVVLLQLGDDQQRA